MVKFTDITLQKDNIRKEILCKLCAQTPENRFTKSAKIKQDLFNNSVFLHSKTVMFYISKDYEVFTDEMIKEALKQDKKIIVPAIFKSGNKLVPCELKNFERELEKGPFGIRQPKQEYTREVPVGNIDMIITPGIAFDRNGNRIGHGKGYYDAFLAGVRSNIHTTALAFDFQVLDKVPTLTQDIPVHTIISA